MLKNVLGLHEVRVEDVMVPRADIVAVPLDMSLATLLQLFRTAGHSRLPVHSETLDDPRGMIHIRDLVDQIARDIPADLADAPPPILSDLARTIGETSLVRPVLFAPPSMPALELLVKMQATRTHMALVIDEYGGTDGLVSLEDLVEMVVGDIEDEHDLDESPKIIASAPGIFVADARADLDEVARQIGRDLDGMTDGEDVDTLGGLVTGLAGHVPVRGEIILEGGLEFEILDADPRRVKRIKIHVAEPPATVVAAKPAAGGGGASLDTPGAPAVPRFWR
jgi:CBS domain containing-hemolysin-like protein